MIGARKDLEKFSNGVCTEVKDPHRCDVIAWIKGFSDKDEFPSIEKVYK